MTKHWRDLFVRVSKENTTLWAFCQMVNRLEPRGNAQEGEASIRLPRALISLDTPPDDLLHLPSVDVMMNSVAGASLQFRGTWAVPAAIVL
jgi:hypothetical protein